MTTLHNPAHCTIRALASSAIRLDWRLANPATVHQIERREADGDWQAIGVAPAGTSSFESIGLRSETVYQHRLRGTEGTPWVLAPEITTPARPPAPVGDLLTFPHDGYRRNSEADLIVLADGRLLLAIGRWPEESDHAVGCCIATLHSSDGEHWEDLHTCFIEDGYDLFHPCLVRLADGGLGCSYTKRQSGKPHCQVGEKVFRRSSDEGRTWSEEVIISDGGWQRYQSSRCGVLRRLASGRLVQPVQRHLVQGQGELQGGIGTHVYTSDDQGRSWQRRTGELLWEPGRRVFHEATCVEYAPGRLLLLGRAATGRLWESRSEDGGDTWSVAQASPCPSSIAPGQLIAVPGGEEILLLWCPCVDFGDYMLGPRRVLAAQRSRDGGRSWFGYRELVHAPVSGRHGWNGYCYAAACWRDDRLHVTYMDMHGSGPAIRQRIFSLERDWILGGQEPATC